MASVRVTRNILVHTLNAHLNAGTSIGQHLREVGRVTVVGAGLDGEPDALGAASLAVCHLHGAAPSAGTTPLCDALGSKLR